MVVESKVERDEAKFARRAQTDVTCRGVGICTSRVSLGLQLVIIP